MRSDGEDRGPAAPDIVPLSTREVYANPWLRVREDRVRRRDGSTGVYAVVEKPDFVTVAALRDGALHLVQQYRYPVGERLWEMPQGASEPGRDADLVAAARRELREETGLEAASFIEAGRLFLAAGLSTQGYRVYLATGLRPAARGAALDLEEQDLVARAFPLPEVERMLCDGVIRDATTAAAFGLLRLKGLL
jgi:ADP-ribose pyrophosphatase